MINVLHSIDTGGPGGAETVFINLVTGLDNKLFNSIAVIPRKGWVYDQLIKNGVDPIIIRSSGAFNIKYLINLIKIIKSKKIDIIQSHLFGSNVYCSLAGLICRIPVISVFHGFVDASENESLASIKFKLINRGSKRVVFVSNQLKSHYQNKTAINMQKSVTIYNGIDTDIYKPKKSDNLRRDLGLSKDHIIIGSIGNIRQSKGYDILIEAAALVVNIFPKCKFVIAGQGSGHLYKHLREKIKRLRLEGIVKFIGFREDAVNILNGIDIFALPSTTEGFSLVTLEAMACGIPVVVTKSGGPEEIIENGRNGIMVDAGSAGSLSAGLIRLVTGIKEVENLTERAMSDVRTKFKKDAMIDKYANLYVNIKSLC